MTPIPGKPGPRRSVPNPVLLTLLGLASGSALPAQSYEIDKINRIARIGDAEEVPEGGHVSLAQALLDVQNDRVIALVASHPDDQYILPAAYLRRFSGYRVAAVLFTRGEGGQNREGPEIGDRLGRLRTLETEVCARKLGFRVYYLNRLDGGYCRTAEEALDLWGRRSTTEDLARLFRKIRPDVVMTTHHPGESHGHDAGLLAILPDAVRLAGDPAFDTDGLAPVVVDRLFRGASENEFEFLLLPVDDVNLELNRTYRRIAYEALTRSHASQAPFRPPGELFGPELRFVREPIRADAATPLSLYEGLPDLFTELAAAGVSDSRELESLRLAFERDLPSQQFNRIRLARDAFELQRRLAAIDAPAGSALAERIERRRRALLRLVRHAVGLVMEVALDDPVPRSAVPGEPLDFGVTLHTAGFAKLSKFRLTTAEGSPVAAQAAPRPRSGPAKLRASLLAPEGTAASSSLTAMYRRDTFELPLRAVLHVDLAVDEVTLGTLRVPFDLPTDVRPAVELEVDPSPLLIPNDIDEVRFSVVVDRNTRRQLVGDLVVTAPAGFKVSPSRTPVDMDTEPSLDFDFRVRIPPGLRSGIYPIRVHIGEWETRVPLRRVAVSTSPALRVGLIEGVDDTAGSVLDFFGIEVVRLTDRQLRTRDLSTLDTILIDFRALPHRPAARAALDRLLAFAHGGGRLVVLYHKDQEFNFESTGVRAYPEGLPLRVGTGRVTREDAPVVYQLPDHALLNRPNPIKPDHWDAWVHERGLYFPDRVDPAYQRILRIDDPEYEPQDTALVYAATGDGEYVYCALALYRQLRNLHPGACRLFANLVSRPERDDRR